MIEVKNVSQTFHTARGPFQALVDVSLSIPKGDFVAIIGRSGAGKSTFLRTLNGLLIPSQGQVVVDGTDITKLPKRELQKYRRTVGFIFQQFNLVTRLSVLDNVLHGRLGYLPTWRGLLGLYSDRDYEIARQQIARVDLSAKETARVDSLSGGQQQRVAIARAMAQEPTLILADEPAANLDPVLSEEVMRTLRHFNATDGVTVVINIHTLELARQYARRIIAFRRGRLVFDGAPQELTEELVDGIYERKEMLA
ncbi:MULTISPECIES: phosphonate ABC transporter ATP-binding protein [unclassified Meiothermus]|uniref:phosphonate ABC transporter ATP-binding protein n=1 Tax=unclassified Meiothermus TaxID=370471 RepID=UPI000D7C0175|nr:MULTISPECIES: phosphonate ABC transporter ATP-binding protein [unclassified Meiothermus]PZA06088.1 phosphonate ABC transporter ATP-binding protein [Meiothermus sp. Pnk-1]RYM35363.1 phosphonate ABC transporter ATP-binding protein [Meiothermus sp. PNK-Is4]